MSNTFRIFSRDSHKALPIDTDTSRAEGPGLGLNNRTLSERAEWALTESIRDYQPPVRGISLDFDGARPHHGADRRRLDNFEAAHYVERARHEVLLSVRLTECGDGIRELGWEGVILRQHFGTCLCVHGPVGQPPVRNSVTDGLVVCTRIGKVTTDDILDRCLQDRIVCVLNRKFVPAHATYLGFGVCKDAPDRAIVRITLQVTRKKALTITLGLLPGVEQPWVF